MHNKWNVVILVVIISLSSADHQICYLQSKCGQYTNVTTCEGKVSSPVEIDCQFNSTLNQSIVPSSSSFLWWKDGNMLNNISKTMIVDPFTPGDAGNYRCEVHYHDHVTFCGQVQLKVELTRPIAPQDCTPNPSGNHNCSCTLYINPVVGCQQLITPCVGGYPEPNITWLFNDTIAGSDNQNILAVKDNGSALVDLQLWSMEENEDKISILAHNDLEYLMICFHPYFWNNNDIKNLHIDFSLSAKPLQLKKGDSNVDVKSCLPQGLIGQFYMCYSKNLSDLEKLEVDAQHCCYCSREGSEDCMKIFPNWNLTDAGSSVTKCYLSLMTVNETDAGYYQCRLSLVESNNHYRNCKLRYGDITYVSVSNHSHSNTNIGDWIHGHVTITCVIVIFSAVFVIVITWMMIGYCVYKKRKTRRNYGYGFRHSRDDDDGHHEVTAPLIPDPAATNSRHTTEGTDSDDSADNEGRITQEIDSANNEQESTRQETDANAHSELVPSVTGAKRPKVHIMFDDSPATRRWVDDTLKKKLTNMRFELAHKIGGRPWIGEVIRMINEGCKIIMIFTKEISNQLTTKLIFALSKQNINKTSVIPIMFYCEVDDLSNKIQSYLSPYTVLRHDELDDDLLQSLTA